jgi:penicillin-binding protein 1A
MEQVGLGQLGEQFEFADWDRPDAPARPPARLYLPGTECLYEIIGYEVPETVPPSESAPPAPDGLLNPAAPPATQPPQDTTPEAVDPPETTTTTTSPPVPIFGPVDGGTTIPPDVVDPKAPLPSAPTDQLIQPCP